jgi:hypothetical protein
MPAERRAAVGERGQVLVIFVLSLVALMAAAGLAVDMGRFYSERRFLQNAATRRPLAAKRAIRGGTEDDAGGSERHLSRFSIPPNGGCPTGRPVRQRGPHQPRRHAPPPLDGPDLGGSVRVAIRNTIPYTFGRSSAWTRTRSSAGLG